MTAWETTPLVCKSCSGSHSMLTWPLDRTSASPRCGLVRKKVKPEPDQTSRSLYQFTDLGQKNESNYTTGRRSATFRLCKTTKQATWFLQLINCKEKKNEEKLMKKLKKTHHSGQTVQGFWFKQNGCEWVNVCVHTCKLVCFIEKSWHT
jgi:hypothetical protein